MNLSLLAVIAASLLATTEAKQLPFDSVTPFPESEGTTKTNAAALKFKPQLNVVNGCYPHPAVDKDGNTNEGLGLLNLDTCGEPSLGSQLYGRAEHYSGYYAFMYAYYFPRDRAVAGGSRHGWEHAVVWVKKAGLKTGEIEAVSTSSMAHLYSKFAPPDADVINETSVKLEYKSVGLKHYLNVTTEPGDFQDLIMWDDLTDAARVALNSDNWDKASVPMNDKHFERNLVLAFPYSDSAIDIVNDVILT